MFNYEKTMRQMKDIENMSSKKQKKVIRGLFFDDTFTEWLFQPPKEPNLNDLVEKLYIQFTKPAAMAAIVAVIKDEGYDEFNRSHATFLYSIANVAISENNDILNDISKQKKAGELSNKEARRLMDDIDDANEIIASLLKCIKKINKNKAKKLAKASSLPTYICASALHSVPEPKLVDRFKIGFYLKNMLNTIYSDVEQNGEFDEDVDWKVFFREIFGKDNVSEVATFILLEGVNRIDKYKNSVDVKICWDTLTSFALKQLNDSPQALRTQMVELYLKRIDKMFANRSFDLRVNLMDLSKKKFPNLVETVEKYADRLNAILTRHNVADE